MADLENPTSIEDKPWLIYPKRDGNDVEKLEKEAQGKWILFRNFSTLNATWKELIDKVKSKDLDAFAMTCSTHMYNPSATGPGPCTSGAIRVYVRSDTEMHKVGEQLVQIVKHDISYKDERSDPQKYNFKSDEFPAPLKYYWNEGNPQLITPAPNSFSVKEDRFKMNVVQGPLSGGRIHGQWIFKSTYDNLTKDWEKVKDFMMSGNLQAIDMICPLKRAPPDWSPQIIVRTTQCDQAIGEQLSKLMQREVVYQLPAKIIKTVGLSVSAYRISTLFKK